MIKIHVQNGEIVINENSFKQNIISDCAGDCVDIPIYMSEKLIIDSNKIGYKLKKDYQILTIKDKYILKNSKNNALIDSEVYKLLDSFDRDNIPNKLLEKMYQLEFLVDG